MARLKRREGELCCLARSAGTVIGCVDNVKSDYIGKGEKMANIYKAIQTDKITKGV